MKYFQEFKDLILQSIPDFDFDNFWKHVDIESQKTLRYNPYKSPFFTQKNDIAYEPYAQIVDKNKSFVSDPHWHAGAYYVQDASSMSLAYIFEILFHQKTHLKILDLCAAPGGKSTHILSKLHNTSVLVSNEVIVSRLQILKENIIKWGKANVIITNNEAKDFSYKASIYDAVIVDAPCSGEGLFRKNQKARNEWSIDHVNLCSLRQKKIIHQIKDAIKPGGYLIYSTCTFNTQENEAVGQAIVDLGFENIKLDEATKLESFATQIDGIHGFRFMLHTDIGEGFFISIFKKRGNSIPNTVQSKKPKSEPLLLNAIAKDDFEIVVNQNQYFVKNNEQIFANQWLPKQIKIVQNGFKIAEKKGNDFIPSHEMAMCCDIEKSYPIIEIEFEETIMFLKKLTFTNPKIPLGWVMLSYKHIFLGFVKNLGPRLNNYYPIEWKIRKDI